MIRKEYFIHYRVALLELDDRTLGIYLWHCSGQFNYPASIPPDLGILELYDRIFPTFTPEQESQGVGSKPTASILRKLADYRSSNIISTLKGPALARYEATVLAIGQNARDLLQGDSTALWNVAEARRHLLEEEWLRLDSWAIQAEQSATKARERADLVRTKLNEVLAALERLAKIKPSSN